MKHAWRRMKRHSVPWSILRLRRKIWSKTLRFYVFCPFRQKNGANDRNRQGGHSPTKCFRASGSNRRIVRIAIGLQANQIKRRYKHKKDGKIYFASHFWGYIKAILTAILGKKAKKMEPMIGIEPMTYSLRVNCSTDWATLASLLIIYTLKQYLSNLCW